MRLVPLRKKEAGRLKRSFCKDLPGLCSLIEGSKTCYRIESSKFTIYVFEGIPAAVEFARREGKLYPTLIAVKLGGIQSTHYCVVDKGAVKHILNGANVMAPGIIDVSKFSVGDIVAVWGPDRKAPIAVGEAVMSSDEIMSRRRGKAVLNVHYAGDDVWKLCLEYLRSARK